MVSSKCWTYFHDVGNSWYGVSGHPKCHGGLSDLCMDLKARASGSILRQSKQQYDFFYVICTYLINYIYFRDF